MAQKEMSRRSFMQTAAIGATVAAAGLFTGPSKDEARAGETKDVKAVDAGPAVFVCVVCGHLEFGFAPESCPVCHASKDQFKQNDQLFTDNAAKNKDVEPKHLPMIMVKKESGLITEVPNREIEVRIGKTLHPMEEAHHIRFMECFVDDKFVYRLPFNMLSSALPAAGFLVKQGGAKARIVALCNLHGYWQAEASLG